MKTDGCDMRMKPSKMPWALKKVRRALFLCFYMIVKCEKCAARWVPKSLWRLEGSVGFDLPSKYNQNADNFDKIVTGGKTRIHPTTIQKPKSDDATLG